MPDDEDEWDRERLLLDINLIAIADPMPPGAARVMAACAASSEDGQFTLTELRKGTESRRDAVTADIAQSIVLWSLWRRRNYCGNDDEFPLSMMYGWLSYASAVEDGRPVPHEIIDPDIFTAALTDEDYRAIAATEDQREI